MSKDLVLHDRGVVPNIDILDRNGGNLQVRYVASVVLTSAIITRRSELAIEASTPTRSNSIVEGVNRWTETIKFCLSAEMPVFQTLTSLNFSRFHEWSSPG